MAIEKDAGTTGDGIEPNHQAIRYPHDLDITGELSKDRGRMDISI